MGILSIFRRLNLDDHVLMSRKYYLRSFKEKKAGTTPLIDVEFSVIDTETTGLDPRNDKILSIGVVKVINFSIAVEYNYEGYIRYDNYIPGDEIGVHGIMKRHVAEALSPPETLSDFLRCIGSSVLVGHHIGFDVKMINKALKKYLGIKLKNKVIDTAQLDQRIENPHHSLFRPKTLDELCDKFGIIPTARHSAIGDSYTTALVFMKLLSLLQNKKVNKLSDL